MEIILKAGDALKVPENCTAKIEDGVVLIEEIQPKFKRGDFIFGKNKYCEMIFILDCICVNEFHYLAMLINNEIIIKNFCVPDEFTRHCTPEERQLLIEKLQEAGKDWDAEKCCIVDYEWKPKVGEECFCVSLYAGKYDIKKIIYADSFFTSHLFKTEQLAQAFCDQVNELLKTTKKW